MHSHDSDCYDLKSVRLPYISGVRLRLFVKWVESPLRRLILPRLFRDAGITALRQLEIDEPPTFYPLHECAEPCSGEETIPPEQWDAIAASAPAATPWPAVRDYARAYRNAQSSPTTVAASILKAIEESNTATPPLRAVIASSRDDVLRQAEASEKRLAEGHPRSILEGVPVAVKDELDLQPYPTKVGTRFMGTAPATSDATIVSRLRTAGALLIGKTNMHEIGLGVTGLNPHYGPARNPYDPGHYTGGSSSGSASAVAAGLCPIAVGADGGGSIRIPASFCGLVGLKSTFGRVSEHGAATLCWSVAHNGALAGNAADAALAYAIMAGPDAADPLTLKQPAPALPNWSNLDLSDLTLGVFRPWFRHASGDMVAVCEELLAKFEGMGAKLQEIEIPELEAGRVAHMVSIVAEMTQALARYDAPHGREFGLDIRANLALAREFTARDYLQAQRVRTRMLRHFDRVFGQVDLVVTPATGLPAPAIPATALPAGDSDLSMLTEIMRFVTPANMTGHPAISFPAGYTASGLPIGMQAIGRPWREDTLLRLALASEQVVDKLAPKMRWNPLDGRNRQASP